MVKSSHLPGAEAIRHREYSITSRDTNQGSRHRPQLPFKLPPSFKIRLLCPISAFFQAKTPSSHIFRPISRGRGRWPRYTTYTASTIDIFPQRWSLQDIAQSHIFKAIRAAYLKGFEELVWRVFKTRRGIRLRRPKAF